MSLAAAHRLVTLTGAGGIGKTRLALAAARRLLPQFADGVWLAEFSPIADPGLVPATVAAAMGLDLGGVVSAQRVSQALAGRRLLLVLDTCEHVVSAAAALAEAVLRAGGTLHLLATSREPLRAEGEWVYPVPPLAVPSEDAEDADDLLRYGGVRLFVERLRAAEPTSGRDAMTFLLVPWQHPFARTFRSRGRDHFTLVPTNADMTSSTGPDLGPRERQRPAIPNHWRLSHLRDSGDAVPRRNRSAAKSP